MKYRSYAFPWHHYTFNNFFTDEDFHTLKNLEINQADYSNITGYRDVIKGRTFLNNKAIEHNPALLPIARWLDRKEYYKNCFDTQITNTFVRAEIIHDRYPFFHDVHVDLPCKNLTIIVNIDKDDDKNLATDLYHTKQHHAKKLKWIANGGVAFKITPDRWHGFEPIEYVGIRKIMIINYVTIDEWRDKDQLFIDNF